jgi:hypothetical protein
MEKKTLLLPFMIPLWRVPALICGKREYLLNEDLLCLKQFTTITVKQQLSLNGDFSVLLRKSTFLGLTPPPHYKKTILFTENPGREFEAQGIQERIQLRE